MACITADRSYAGHFPLSRRVSPCVAVGTTYPCTPPSDCWRASPRAAGSGRLRDDPDVGLGLSPAAEDVLRLLVGDRAGADDVPPLPPVRRRGGLVLGGQLEGVD